jgi:flagellar basal-body rod protein FlgG
MIRGWYIGASGMNAQQARLDAISNNLANVDTTGYKRDVAVQKAFSELLLRRMNDDGVYELPGGTGDRAPIIGKIGMGVETNEFYTVFDQGSFKATGSNLDVALTGEGFIAIETPRGERYTRNGSFKLGKEGILETKDGYPVLGENGPLQVKANNFQVDKEGGVWINAAYADDPMVGRENNTWDDTVLLDKLKLVDFDLDRYLQKQGSSLYRDTDTSGPAQIMERGQSPRVVQGFVETSNVDPVLEMVQMIEVNRAYEANQKVVQSEDSMLGTLLNQIARFG